MLSPSFKKRVLVCVPMMYIGMGCSAVYMLQGSVYWLFIGTAIMSASIWFSYRLR